MKRILHMTPPEINNGIYQYLFNHMKYIDQSKYRFEFLTRNKTDLMRTTEYQNVHFPIWSFENTEREGREGLRKEISSILDQGFDAIHLHTSFWRGFLIEELAMQMGVPQIIVHAHSAGIDFVSPDERSRLLAIHENYKCQFHMGMATDVCACSMLAGEWLYGDNIPKNQIRILKNAVDIERYRFQPKIRAHMRRKLGLNDKLVIGNIGRYSYQKNQAFLIRAFAKAYQKNNRLFLLLIGQGALKAHLMSLIKELGLNECAVCMDWQEHVEDYLQVMDIFCLPSHFEGLVISAIEAQAMGIKCLVSDKVSEEVKITNLLEFLPLEENRWASLLEETVRCDDRKQMADEISKHGYDIQSAAKKLMLLYG